MQRGILTLAVILFSLGAFYVVQALSFPMGTSAQPGPGAYALLVGGLIVVSAMGTAAEAGFELASLGGQQDVPIAWPSVDGRIRILSIVFAAIGYVFLVGHVGHLIAAFLAGVVVMRTQGDANWLSVVFWAAALSAISYYGFVVLLGVQFPGTSFLG